MRFSSKLHRVAAEGIEGIDGIVTENEGADGVLGGGADEVGALDPAGDAAIERLHQAPDLVAGALEHADRLLIVEAAKAVVPTAGAAQDFLRTAGDGGEAGGAGR